jgi:hypothetical protein
VGPALPDREGTPRQGADHRSAGSGGEASGALAPGPGLPGQGIKTAWSQTCRVPWTAGHGLNIGRAKLTSFNARVVKEVARVPSGPS